MGAIPGWLKTSTTPRLFTGGFTTNNMLELGE
jgi:hypothetical protein